MESNHKKIEVFLNGGLGNQLFGLAAGYSLAKNLSLELTLNVSNLKHRGFQLQDLKEFGYEINGEVERSYSIENRFLKRMHIFVNRRRNFYERSFSYDKRIEKISRPTRLHGYFQSFKYFEKNIEDLRCRIKNSLDFTDSYLELRETLRSKRTIAVHVRRGDYLDLIDYHGIMERKYYKRALIRIKDEIGTARIALFTDDYVAANSLFPNADFIISHSELNSPLETICLMSELDGVIGANSSFSYWAAMLNENLGSPKIFPKEWFSNSSIKTEDLLPRYFQTVSSL